VPQPHKNLFFYYRGRASGDESGLLLERQLEDNATKALIFVLEHCDRALVLEPFLRAVAGVQVKSALNEVQFALQRVDIARPIVHQRVALCIAPDAVPSAGQQGQHDSGRPDAWIWCDGAFSVLVETKVRGQANLAQIDRHVGGAEGWSNAKVDRRSISWGEVYEFFLGVRRKGLGAHQTTRLLLDELLRYIRMIGLGSDTTFDLDDFGFFLLKSDDRDDTVRSLLTRKLLRFTEELTKTEVVQSVVHTYGARGKSARFVNPGVFRKTSDNFWISIGPKARRKACHFTIRLSETGIALEAFSPYKSFTSPLIAKIAASPSDFLRSLKSLKDPSYQFRLREAHYDDPESSYKGQRIGWWLDYLHIHPSVLNRTNVSQLIVDPIRRRLGMSDLRPELFLVRQFTLSELVGNSNIVDDVAAAAKPMLPYLRFALDL
jgi:hypothetical protein